MKTREQKLRQRLSGYWKMEAANVLFVPAFAFLMAEPDDTIEIACMAVVFAGVALLLIVGAAYWRGVLKRKLGDPAALRKALRLADVSEIPSLIFAFLGLAAAIAVAFNGSSLGVIVTCWVGWLLLVLEYVNYYRVQLQHFDNVADFKRLLAGKGFRRAHMARDLADYRAGA